MGSRVFAWLRAVALVGVVLLMAAVSSGALQSLGANLAGPGSVVSYGARLKQALKVDVAAAADNSGADNEDDADNSGSSDNSDDEDNSGSDADNEDNSDSADNSGSSDNSDDADNSGSSDNEDNSASDGGDDADNPDIVIDNVAADDIPGVI
jgi:hypothetical protein